MNVSNFYLLLVLTLLFTACVNIDKAKDTISELKMENDALQEQINVAQELILQLNTQIRASKETIKELERISNDKKLKSLTISDKKGLERIKMFVDEEGVPRIRIYNELLEPTISLFSYPINSKGKGASGYAIVGKDEKPIVWLGNVPNEGSRLSIYDNNNALRVTNGVNDNNTSFVSVYSPDMKSFIQASSFPDGRIIHALVDNGQTRQANVVDSQSQSFQIHYDSKGKIKQGVYIPLDDSKFENYVYRKPRTVLWDWLSNAMTARSLFK